MKWEWRKQRALWVQEVGAEIIKLEGTPGGHWHAACFLCSSHKEIQWPGALCSSAFSFLPSDPTSFPLLFILCHQGPGVAPGIDECLFLFLPNHCFFPLQNFTYCISTLCKWTIMTGAITRGKACSHFVQLFIHSSPKLDILSVNQWWGG